MQNRKCEWWSGERLGALVVFEDHDDQHPEHPRPERLRARVVHLAVEAVLEPGEAVVGHLRQMSDDQPRLAITVIDEIIEHSSSHTAR